MSDQNPFEEIQNLAKREHCEAEAAKKMSTARSLLVMHPSATHVFFASLALKLDLVPCWSIPTAATDGKKILYNPEFMAGLSQAEVNAVNLHQVLHCANGHHWRMTHCKDMMRSNVACDLSINPIIRDAKFTLPQCALFPGQGQFAKFPVGLSAEEYYRMLPEGMGGGQGQGAGDDPGGCGGIQAPGNGDQSDMAQSKADWEMNVAQAHEAAKKRGNLPGWIDRFVGEVLTPKVNWREVLRDFVVRASKNDYRWNPPNRRHVWQGIYLPSVTGEQIEGIYIAVDTSGSIGQKELSEFAGEIEGICQTAESKLTILYHDSKVAHVQLWEPSDGPLVLQPKGGGGTSHVPVFEWLDANGEDVQALVCLTDLYTEFPAHGPDFPTLWVVKGNKDGKAPFGTTIHLED